MVVCKRTFRLAAKTLTVAANSQVTVKLRLPAELRRAARRVLRAHKRVTLKARLRATDGAGGVHTDDASIRIRI